MEIRLSPGSELTQPDQPVTVIWNDTITQMRPDAQGHIVLTAPEYAPAELRKRPELAGPMGHAKVTPFLIVAGTQSDDELTQRILTLQSEGDRDDYERWQHVRPRYKLDTEVTEEDMAACTLVLYGGAEENLVTRKLLPELPLEINGDTVVIDGRRFDAPDAAVHMIYPNPRNPQRYVLVQAGTSPAGLLAAAQPPGAYDYSITDARVTEDAGLSPERMEIARGRFDYNWRLDEAYLFERDPALRLSLSEAREASDGFDLKAALIDTKWEWNGADEEVVFERSGFVGNPGWEERGLRTSWLVIDERTVLLIIETGRTTERYAVLRFGEDMTQYTGHDFRRDRKIPPSKQIR